VTALAAVAFLGCSAVLATSSARRSRPKAQCASLGNAASFVAFSDGAFNSSESSGTSITGRIAAASDVTLDGVTVNPAAGDSAPTVIAGGNFVAGATGHRVTG
jgi:hypothetical protein